MFLKAHKQFDEVVVKIDRNKCQLIVKNDVEFNFSVNCM